jgi:hypothetical protein
LAEARVAEASADPNDTEHMITVIGFARLPSPSHI